MSPPSLPSIPRRILPAIAVSQFAGTSLWFAINAVVPDLQQQAGLPATAAGWLTGVRFFSVSTRGSVSFTIWFATSFATCAPKRRESTSRGALPGRKPFT